MDKQQAAALLAEHSQSGLSVKTFCQQKQISYHTFQYWRRKEKRLNQKKSPFIRVQTKSTSPSGKVEVLYSNGIIVRLESFDPAHILQLLKLGNV